MILIGFLCFVLMFMVGYGVIKHIQWRKESRERITRLSKCPVERDLYKVIAKRYIEIGGSIFSGAGRDMLKEVEKAERLADAMMKQREK